MTLKVPHAWAGVRRQWFHDVGNAFATVLLEAGEELATFSMLGHADYSTSVDVTRNLSTRAIEGRRARVDSLLKRRAEAI